MEIDRRGFLVRSSAVAAAFFVPGIANTVDWRNTPPTPVSPVRKLTPDQQAFYDSLTDCSLWGVGIAMADDAGVLIPGNTSETVQVFGNGNLIYPLHASGDFNSENTAYRARFGLNYRTA